MFAGLMIAYAALAVVLAAYLFARLLQVDKHLRLQRFRSTRPGVADLLDYAAVVADGVVVGKSGTLMAGWIYRGPDNGSATDAEREQLSARINHALRGLGSGWMLHIDAVRFPEPAYTDRDRSQFPDWVCQRIDDERRAFFEGQGAVYDGYFVLVLSWLPPSMVQRRVAGWMLRDTAAKPNEKEATLRLIETFEQHVSTIEGRLSSAFQLKRLRSQEVVQEDGRRVVFDDFLRWLQFCITGNDQPMALPRRPWYLDALLGGQDLWGGTVPTIGGKFVRVVAIEGFPLESTPGILTALGEMRSQYRWSNRFILLDQHQSIGILKRYQSKWAQKVHGFLYQVFGVGNARPDQDAMEMVQEGSDAIQEASSGLTAMGYYTGVVVLMNESREIVDAEAKAFEKLIQSLGFVPRIETVNAMDAWLGSLPGHAVPNVRRPLCNSLNFADMLPVSSIWAGRPYAPCPFYPAGSPPLMHVMSAGSTAFRLNLHVGDVGMVYMAGPIGSGKSTLIALTAAQLRRYLGLQIFAFDKGNSLYPLTAAIHAATKGETGAHYDLGEGGRLSFAPLQYLDTPADRGWAADWLEELFALNGVEMNPDRRNTIAASIAAMHKRGPGSRSLSDLMTDLQDAQLRAALEGYTHAGPMGHLFDATSDTLALSDFTVFEIGEVMSLGSRFVLPLLRYLFRRIERRLDGRPSAIILDEVWMMLDQSIFRSELKKWLKQLRKANCMVIMATQSLTDASRSAIFDTILESCEVKIFLANMYAKDEELEDGAKLYYKMGLNKRQAQLIGDAVKKRDYYFASPEGQRMFQLALGPFALAFVGHSSPEDISTIKALEAVHGHEWIGHWLKQVAPAV